jgi:hypothetical protein
MQTGPACVSRAASDVPTPLPVSTDPLTTLIEAEVERLDLLADPAQGPPWSGVCQPFSVPLHKFYTFFMTSHPASPYSLCGGGAG